MITGDATATPPVVETEEDQPDSTNLRVTAGGEDVTPSGSRQHRGRTGRHVRLADLSGVRTPSTSSTNSGGFRSPVRGGSSGGGRSMTRSSTRLSSSRRESSDCGGSEVSSRRGGSGRRLFREGSGAKASSVSTHSVGSSGSNAQHESVDAFLKAAGEGNERTVVHFLDSGGDVNAKTKTGTSTALSRASAKGHVDIVTLLLGRGASVNAPGRGGLTPLHEAAGCGKVEVCRVLLGAGAAVAARDHSSRCPLHYASNSLEVTQLLLDYGADPNAKDKNGQCPDTMSVNSEARAMLRDARSTVREYGVGDNASRVIASLRRELENMEHEIQVAKSAEADEAERSEQLRLELAELRDKISVLSQDVERFQKEAAAAKSARANKVPDAIQAELVQLRASLRVARAAAAEEKRRREALEEEFDATVAEAVAKAIAAAATRLLDRMPGEQEGEDERGSGEGTTVEEHDHGDGDANLPEPVRALPAAARGSGGEGGTRENGPDVEELKEEEEKADQGVEAEGVSGGDGSEGSGQSRGSSVELQGGEEPLEEVRAIAAAGNLTLFPGAFLRRRHSLGAGVASQRLGRRLERVSSTGFRSRSIGEGSGNLMEAFEGDQVDGKRFRGEVQGGFAAKDLMKSKSRVLASLSPTERRDCNNVSPEENHEEGEMKRTIPSMPIEDSVAREVTESTLSWEGERGVNAWEGEGAPDVSRDFDTAAGHQEGLEALGGVQRDEVCWSGAGAGGLGAESASVASDDRQDWRRVVALWADECEGRYDDDDDDDDDDCLYLSEKEKLEAARQTTDARIWRALAAAIKVELEEVKVRLSDLSTENRRLRREAVNRSALQRDTERHRPQEDFGRAQGLSRAVKATYSVFVRMLQSIPRVAHVYWENEVY